LIFVCVYELYHLRIYHFLCQDPFKIKISIMLYLHFRILPFFAENRPRTKYNLSRRKICRWCGVPYWSLYWNSHKLRKIFPRFAGTHLRGY